MRNTKLQVKEVPIASLKPYENNAKKHTLAQIEAVSASIEEFGFRNPVIVWHNEQGEAEIVAGHARVTAAKRLGMEVVPVIVCDDLTDAQRRALTLADNQTTMMTGWDEDMLAYELDVLAGEFDMKSFGFEEMKTISEEIEAEEPFAEYLDEDHEYIVLKFSNHEDFTFASELLGLERCDLLATGSKPRYGIGRVLDGVRALERAKAN